jgi:hypothetical protein
MPLRNSCDCRIQTNRAHGLTAVHYIHTLRGNLVWLADSVTTGPIARNSRKDTLRRLNVTFKDDYTVDKCADFLNKFSLWTDVDPTNGCVDYVS